jgi:hypothetical protein
MRMILWLVLMMSCVWAMLICGHAALYWRAMGDGREGLCWLLVLAFALGTLMSGYQTRER